MDVTLQNLDRIEKYVDELDRTVEATLLLIRDHSRDLSEAESITASRLVELIQQRSSQSIANNIAFKVRVNEDQEVKGHAVLLTQAASNLIENAMRYAKSQVTLTVETSEHGSKIIVEDDGPGIPESSRNDVLSPFFRLDPSRTRGTGGVGLGLAISKNIATRHGGSLSVGKSELGGALFVLSWR